MRYCRWWTFQQSVFRYKGKDARPGPGTAGEPGVEGEKQKPTFVLYLLSKSEYRALSWPQFVSLVYGLSGERASSPAAWLERPAAGGPDGGRSAASARERACSAGG